MPETLGRNQGSQKIAGGLEKGVCCRKGAPHQTNLRNQKEEKYRSSKTTRKVEVIPKFGRAERNPRNI